jgi:hypothetical protein
MKLTSYRPPAQNGKEILFPRLESWNPLSKTGTIAAQVNKKRVLCRISMKILQQKFHATADNPLRAIKENRAVIEAAARKLIERGGYEEDGSIIIQAADL